MGKKKGGASKAKASKSAGGGSKKSSHSSANSGVDKEKGAKKQSEQSLSYYGKTDPEDNIADRDINKKTPKANWNVSDVPKDMVSYAVDKQLPENYNPKAKDIKRHSHDSELSYFEKAVLCIRSQEDGQIKFVAANVHNLQKQNSDRTFQEIIPIIDKYLNIRMDMDLHTKAANSFLLTLKQVYKKNSKHAKTLLNTTNRCLELPDVAISNCWVPVLEGIAEFFTTSDLEKELAFLAPEKGRHVSTNAKRAACLMIPKLAPRYSESAFKSKIFPVVIRLSNDDNPLVRLSMIRQLPEILKSYKGLKDEVLDVIVKHQKDKNPNVQAALVGSIGRCIVVLEGEKASKFYATCLPIYKRSVKYGYVLGNSFLLMEFADTVGHTAKTLREADALKGDDKLWFLDAYVQICRYGLPKRRHAELPTGIMNFRANLNYARRRSLVESMISHGKYRISHPGAGWRVRSKAAKSYPAFFSFAKPLVEFKHGLHPVAAELMHDPHPKVRAAMSASIYPVMKKSGKEATLMVGEVVYALSDDNVAVIEAVVANLTSILKIFVQYGVISAEKKTSSLVEIGGAILFCEERLNRTHEWRVHINLLAHMSVLPFCMPSDYIFQNFVPILLHRLLRMKKHPCREAAADTVIIFLRFNRREKQREEIRSNLRKRFARGRGWNHRMIYCYMAKGILEHFSYKYFRDHFFESTLALANDRVVNIRIKVCELMPGMKRSLKRGGGNSGNLSKKLDSTIARLKNSDKDRDVQEAVKVAQKEMGGMGGRGEGDDDAKEKEEERVAALEKHMPPLQSYKKSKSKHHGHGGQGGGHHKSDKHHSDKKHAGGGGGSGHSSKGSGSGHSSSSSKESGHEKGSEKSGKGSEKSGKGGKGEKKGGKKEKGGGGKKEKKAPKEKKAKKSPKEGKAKKKK